MGCVGPLHLLVIGFDADDPIPAAIRDVPRRRLSRADTRVLEVLFVSKDRGGGLHIEPDRSEPSTSTIQARSALWPVLSGDDSFPSNEPLDLRPASEVGLDLDALEELDRRIGPGTSAVLILTEETWIGDLLDRAADGGGHAIALGYLQPETMLDLGPGVVEAVKTSDVAVEAATAKTTEVIDTLTSAPDPTSRVAAEVLRALVGAQLINIAEVGRANATLADAGLVRSSAPLSASAADPS